MSAFAERFAGQFILAWGRKRALLALAAGAVAALGMPPLDIFPALFVALPCLVWLMDATAADPATSWLARLRGAFSTGWWFGFGFFLAGLWWIGNAVLVEADAFGWLLPFAVLLIPAGLAVFFGLGTAFARCFWHDDWRRILALAAGLGLAEFLRGHVLTGFPWNTLGYAAMTMPLTMQSAALIGLYGVTLLAVMVFAAPALLAEAGARSRNGKLFLVTSALIVAGHVGYGAWRLNQAGTNVVEGVSLRLVQPNVDQSEKWSQEAADRNFRLLLDLSTTASTVDKPGLPGTDLLIWPETAFPFILTERRDALAALGAMLPAGTRLLAGAVRLEAPAPGETRERAFNAIYSIDENGEIKAAADKVHLVPFGEFLPLQDWLEKIGLEQLTRMRGGFEAGAARTLMDGGNAGRFLPLVCYEIIFAGQLLSGDQRPDWILNVTNDAWFGNSPGPYQHSRKAIIRGVEEGLPVVRAANSGISTVSDPFGRITAKIDLGVRGVADTGLPEAIQPTAYSQYRNHPFFAFLVALVLICLPGRRTR